MANNKIIRTISIDIDNVVLTNTSTENGGIGPKNIEFEKDDFVDKLKVKIGDLVSQKSKQEHNSQVISTDSIEISSRMPDGKPAPLGPSNSSEETYFEQVFESSTEGQKALSAFETDSHLLDYKIAKGKTIDPSLPSIDQVIEEINILKDQANLNKEIQVKLGSYNKLSPNNAFINSDETDERKNPNFDKTIQNQKGKHLPSTWPDSNLGPTSKLTLQDLTNLGLQIMLEGSGELKVPKEKDKPIDLEKTQALISVTPGLARLGLRVPYSNFLPGNIMEQVNSDYSKPGKNPLENESGRMSHGHFNNPLVPFNSLNTTTNRIVAGILILAVSQMLRGLARTINTDKVFSALNQVRDFKVPFDNNNSPSIYEVIDARLGSSKGTTKNSNGVLSFANPDDILFSRNYNQFATAVDRGIVLFFELGTNDPIGLTNPLIRSFTANTNPGYYNVILRMLINDVNNVFSSLIPANLTSIKDPTEIDRSREIMNDPSSATIGALDNTINLINTLRESKLLRFMDILSKIGDLSLMNEGDRRFSSIIDSIPDTTTNNNSDLVESNINIASLHKKNRLSDEVIGGRGNLAWGSNKLPSMYLLPNNILDAEAHFSNKRTLHTTLTKDRNFIPNSSGRLPVEFVVEMEKMLDSYYVPFYFQDLRTNEIIAFQSFIETIGDAFDPQYSETEGIGRIDSVMKYKNTKRNLSVSFFVVATNKADFDEMWLKINKFIMMVYPQYTAGREVISDGNKFIQPFSQLIGASPLVRMRIGDLIKTNHSDFDAARLFGAGTGNFELQNQQFIPATQKQSLETTKASDVRNKMRNGIFSNGQKFRLTQPYSAIIAGANNSTVIQLLPGSLPNRLSDNQAGSNPSQNTSQIGSVVNGRLWIEIPTNTSLTVTNADTTNRLYQVVSEQDVAGLPKGQRFAIQFVDNVSDIAMNESDIHANIQVSIPSTNENEQVRSQPNEFFSIENNPIYQSFDSVRGQGLAGFIRSLKFDFNETIWETEGLNNRAPKFIKIDLDFSPIHDISPGLDSNGFMIGSPYNIGEIMKALKKEREERMISVIDALDANPNGNR